MFATSSTHRLLAGFIGLLLLEGWAIAQEKTSPVEKQPASKDAEKLQALLKDRRDEAQKVVDVCLVKVKAGLAVPDLNLLEASRILLFAELELMDKPEERIALHKKYVERAKDVEDVFKRMAGKVDPAGNAQVQASRCEAEIGLLRERAGDKPSASQAEEIKKLLVERRDALRGAVKLIDAKVQGGLVVPYAGQFELSRQLARVEVELAENSKERIAAREEHVKRAKECEKIADAMTKNGKAPPDISLSARASRSEADIGLLRDQAGDKATAEQLAEIKKLHEEYRDALRKEFEIRNARVLMGLSIPDRALLDTIGKLLQAELELADKSEQRVSAIKDRLKDLQECEKIAEVQESVGKSPPGNYAQAKVARLDMEIGLLRERMKAKPREK